MRYAVAWRPDRLVFRSHYSLNDSSTIRLQLPVRPERTLRGAFAGIHALATSPSRIMWHCVQYGRSRAGWGRECPVFSGCQNGRKSGGFHNPNPPYDLKSCAAPLLRRRCCVVSSVGRCSARSQPQSHVATTKHQSAATQRRQYRRMRAVREQFVGPPGTSCQIFRKGFREA